jgi:energy-converting hydrogenase Eha subunit B
VYKSKTDIQCINCNLLVIGMLVNILHVKIKSHEGHVYLLIGKLARVYHLRTMI